MVASSVDHRETGVKQRIDALACKSANWINDGTQGRDRWTGVQACELDQRWDPRAAGSERSYVKAINVEQLAFGRVPVSDTG